jgi:glycyl-tRNA synthetase
MVVEMTSLQGIMGEYYARQSAEPESVAKAIREHYLPRFAGDDSPQTLIGLAVGLADRLDTLAGLFAIGLAPTGTKDPYGQRRAALGVVGNLIDWDLDFDLRAALQAASKHLPVEMSSESLESCLDFIVERQRNLLLDAGERFDVVDAVLSVQGHTPTRAAQAVQELKGWVGRSDWHEILPAYARCVRIIRDLEEIYSVNTGDFELSAEQALYQALLTAEGLERKGGSVNDFLDAFTPLIPLINNFFDQVLVMTEAEAQRQNRLALLQRISALAEGAN